MNNINPIFEALGDVNERHVPVTEEKRSSKKLKIALISMISAAALTLIVGAASRANSTFLFGYNDEYGHGFTLDLYSNEYTVPEECEPEPGKTFFAGSMDMPASELVKKFGLPMLMNENFSDIEAKKEYEKPFVIVSSGSSPADNSASFGYYLHDNIIDKRVRFYPTYYLNTDGMELKHYNDLSDGEAYEIIRLNNGSLCLVTEWDAHFCYYGAQFLITLPDDRPEGYEDWTFDEQAAWLSEQPSPGMDTVKQVLTDLGIYDPE